MGRTWHWSESRATTPVKKRSKRAWSMKPDHRAPVLLHGGIDEPIPNELNMLTVAHAIAPAPVGGAECVVSDLCGELSGLGVRVHLLLTLDAGAREHPWPVRNGDAVSVHPLRFPPRSYLRERAEAGSWMQVHRPDAVHTHGYRSDVILGGVARSLGIPTVTTVHGFTGGGVRSWIYQQLQLRAMRKCDAVVAVSEALRKELSRDGIHPERLHLVPNARRTPERILDTQEARLDLGLPPEGFHVGWIGRVSREKGPDVMLRALHGLVSETGAVPVHATFIGDGPERPALIRHAEELEMSGSVHWLGIVPDAARFIRAFDVIVLSSRTEGTPIVAIEAMLAGVPLVATSVGGVPDLAGHGERALLVRSEDPDGLRAAITQVRDDPDAAAARVSAGRSFAAAKADPTDWARRYLEIYQDVLRGGSVTEPGGA